MDPSSSFQNLTSLFTLTWAILQKFFNNAALTKALPVSIFSFNPLNFGPSIIITYFCRSFNLLFGSQVFISHCLLDIFTWMSQSLPNTAFVKLNYLLSQVCSCFFISIPIVLQVPNMEFWVLLSLICLLYPSLYPTPHPNNL